MRAGAECQWLSVFVVADEVAVVVDEAPVAECLLHLPKESVAFEGTPSAATDDGILGQRPCLATDEDEVGLVAFAYEASLFYAEQACWGVAHQFHQSRQSEDAILHELQHGGQRKLYHGYARGCSCASTLLFGEEVRCVVCSYGGDASVGDGLAMSEL